MTPGDSEPLDHVWGAVRKAKEREMAASPSKIKSLERGRSPPILHSPLRRGVPLQPAAQAASRVPSPAPPLRRQRSIVEFRDSPDGTRVTAKFDIPGVDKEDMNVTYHPFPARLEISWTIVEVTERDVEECMTVREERTVCRTILLPEGTRFDEIDAKLHRRLEVTYPKVRAARAKPRTPTPQRRGLPRHGGSERTLDAW
jgi:HSP20 family molecular chaperone IbpA